MSKSVETIHVRVNDTSDVVWEGEAVAVSSVNSAGPFDILPMHANFLTLVKDTPIHVKLADGSEKKYNFKYSVMHVEDNIVKIYTDLK